MIGQIIRSLGGYAKSYIDAKTAVKITKAEIKKKQLTGEIDCEQLAIWASKGSYKDEAWTIVFILILAGNLSPLLRTPWREDLPTLRRPLVGSVGNVCVDCRQLWNKNEERFDQMKDNFMKCLEMLLEHEGGFTADKRDPGNKGDWHGNQGSTNLGMTAHVLAEWIGKPAPIEVMKTLAAETVAPLYKAGYWDAFRGDDLASGLDWASFDWCANS